MEKLTKKELLKLIYSYSEYVLEYIQEHEEGNIPVCIEEYYYNEYQVREV